MKIHFLPAFHGDAIWLNYNDSNGIPRNILIDGGPAETYSEKDKKGKIEFGILSDTINSIRDNEQRIDLLILTHVDDDHINGLMHWINDDVHATSLIDRIWFNSGKLIFEHFNVSDIIENHIALSVGESTDTSIKDGVTFENLIKNKGIWEYKIIKQGQSIELLDLKFRILSPDEDGLRELLHKWEKKEPESLTAASKDYKKTITELLTSDVYAKDPSIHNGSSIAFIITYNGKDMLFLADAHPEKIVEGLKHFEFTKDNPLVCEFVKISHHGSKYNTSYKLLELIESPTYVISSNGSKRSPYKQCLARIIDSKKDLSLFFNYPELAKDIFLNEDFENYPDLKILPVDYEFRIA
ncbi:ComEC/Rec2 family competence protein [Sphingobacterium siyangense]|uniref:Beta-lactamase superfamily II metal-dependent hydrolase n=1 Tax=Sphingobacterium siyangense TaxID=459529 RepID=A0A562M6F1_9SPHI|nr:MBL fold metallo-hydrolase [Sphingobacterium siyangense]TWI15514.1 beta-lactamase superfamily II metal-dependent hydrolase [Sphingobacterium siyangense]